jgi:hypothetical protein
MLEAGDYACSSIIIPNNGVYVYKGKHAINKHGGGAGIAPPFLNFVPDGCELSTSGPSLFTPEAAVFIG